MSPAILLCRRDAAGEERNADYLAGRHSAALCHGVVAGLVCRRTTAGRCVITCVLSRRYGGAGCGGPFRIFQQQDIRTISATLLNENGVTEWTPLFYEDHPAREFCVQYGESDRRFGAAVGGGGDFLLERFCGGQSGAEADAVRRCGGLCRRGASVCRTHRQERRRSVSVCSVMRRMSARLQSRDYTFKVPDWPGCMSSRVRA